MSDKSKTVKSLESQIQGSTPCTIADAEGRLAPLSIGLTQKIPVAFRNARMFRVRKMDRKPDSTGAVGTPPANITSIGRLNDDQQSVLYLSDSPATAFAEAQASIGGFCLSEWRVEAEKLGMANGGISPQMLADRFPKHIYESDKPFPVPTNEDLEILRLFRTIFTLNIGKDPNRYRWSIACGLVNGFSYKCDRQSSEYVDGITTWKGRYPLAAIAYPSVRLDKTSLNYAFNDLGGKYISLHHVQWVRRLENGDLQGLDFANGWSSDGQFDWQNRAANFDLKPGERAKVTKVAANTWLYETSDGSIPWFS